MKFVSTRNRENIVSTGQAILQGISRDGGLFAPCIFPSIGDLESLLELDYREIALFILGSFFPELGMDYLKESIDKAYDDKFQDKEIASLVDVGDMEFLELYHGPTLAFKDMALSILPYLIRGAESIEKIDKEILILTATSGDTGKAALEGFANVKGIKIMVFYPENGVSNIQRLQMITQDGDNTMVVGIKGNFDHAQSGVKAIFNDMDLKELLDRHDYILSSANSINIGRLIPQIVYYIHGYMSMVKRNKIQMGEKINIVVPTGNFGNILAAYYAKKMGLPIGKLICASNENNVLTDFFNKGVYDSRRELLLTSSPSMDILISSNLERLLFHLRGEDDKLISSKMEDLVKRGYYDMEGMDTQDIYGNYAVEEEISWGINHLFQKYGYLVDPHTAVAYMVYRKYLEETKDHRKAIIVSTASPFKFGGKVASSIGIDIRDEDEFDILKSLSEKTGIDMPSSVERLRDKPVRHHSVVDRDEMKAMVMKFLNIGDIYD